MCKPRKLDILKLLYFARLAGFGEMWLVLKKTGNKMFGRLFEKKSIEDCGDLEKS